jgi:hypothetical protein
MGWAGRTGIIMMLLSFTFRGLNTDAVKSSYLQCSVLYCTIVATCDLRATNEPFPVRFSLAFPSMPLGLAGLRELIRLRRRRPLPLAAAAVRPFYSKFDGLD